MNTRRRVAQIAAEAIINHVEDGYDLVDMETVLSEAREVGVPALYVDMLDDLVQRRHQASQNYALPDGWE